MIFYTYIYRDPSRLNAKGFPEEIYVGKGKKRRAYDHLKRTGMHPFVQRLQFMKKNDIEPQIEIIPAIDESHAYFMEECLIQIIGRKDLGLGSLLNLTDGGEGPAGYKHTESHKIHMSKKTIGKRYSLGCIRTQEFKDNLKEYAIANNVRPGLPKTEQARNNYDKSLFQKGQKPHNFGKFKPVIINNVIFNSVKEAAQVLNINISTIYSNLRTKREGYLYYETNDI